MDVIIVCHTEFGLVHNRQGIADKNAVAGVEEGIKNLVKLADKYDAKARYPTSIVAQQDIYSPS